MKKLTLTNLKKRILFSGFLINQKKIKLKKLRI